jgi:hypothetical protein
MFLLLGAVATTCVSVGDSDAPHRISFRITVLERDLTRLLRVR